MTQAFQCAWTNAVFIYVIKTETWQLFILKCHKSKHFFFFFVRNVQDVQGGRCDIQILRAQIHWILFLKQKGFLYSDVSKYVWTVKIRSPLWRQQWLWVQDPGIWCGLVWLQRVPIFWIMISTIAHFLDLYPLADHFALPPHYTTNCPDWCPNPDLGDLPRVHPSLWASTLLRPVKSCFEEIYID